MELCGYISNIVSIGFITSMGSRLRNWQTIWCSSYHVYDKADIPRVLLDVLHLTEMLDYVYYSRGTVCSLDYHIIWDERCCAAKVTCRSCTASMDVSTYKVITIHQHKVKELDF